MPPNHTKPTANEETVHVQLMVTRIAPDRSPYKQYGIELVPVRMLVSIPVDAKEVTAVYRTDNLGQETDEQDFVVLTLNGLSLLTAAVADTLDQLHNTHLEQLRKSV